MTYTLPRTESGEVDLEQCASDAHVATFDENFPKSAVDIIKSIDANACAEERERCAKVADEEAKGWVGTSGNEYDVCDSIAFAIRHMGDKK